MFTLLFFFALLGIASLVNRRHTYILMAMVFLLLVIHSFMPIIWIAGVVICIVLAIRQKDKHKPCGW
jgi:hypothetical protein